MTHCRDSIRPALLRFLVYPLLADQA
jgi:hypothetical protein